MPVADIPTVYSTQIVATVPADDQTGNSFILEDPGTYVIWSPNGTWYYAATDGQPIGSMTLVAPTATVSFSIAVGDSPITRFVRSAPGQPTLLMVQFTPLVSAGGGSGTAITVVDYGADPTGTTDSTTPILNAITAAIAGDFALEWPTGTYLVSTRILFTGTSGSGQRLVMFSNGDAFVKMMPGFVQTTGYSIFAFTNVDSVEISNLNLDGNRANLVPAVTQHPPYLGGIKITTAITRVTIKDCKFTGFVGDCIDIISGTNVLIDNNEYRDSLAAYSYTLTCTNSNILRNRCYGIGQAGGTNTNIGAVLILDDQSTRTTIAYNLIYNAPDTASKAQGSSQVLYMGNQVDGFGKDGLKIQASDVSVGPAVLNGSIIGNIVTRPLDGRSDGGRCIEMNFVHGGVIANNICTGGVKSVYYDAGITCLNGVQDVEIHDNIVGFFKDFAIELIVVGGSPVANTRVNVHHNKCGQHCQALDSGDVTFEYNHIIGATPYVSSALDGMLIRRCDNVRLNYNHIENFNRAMWVEPDSATVVIQATFNVIANVNDKAIFVRNQTGVAATVRTIDISANEITCAVNVTPNSAVNVTNKDTIYTDLYFQNNRFYGGTVSTAILLLTDEMTGSDKIVRANTYNNQNIGGAPAIVSGTAMVTTLQDDSTFNSDHGGYSGVTGYGGVQIGQFVDLKLFNNVSNPNFQMDISATNLVVVNAAGTTKKLTTVSTTVDITVSGLGGLDTGAEAGNTTYYFYIVYNPTTGVVGGLMSLNSNPAAGVTLPSGFTMYALVGAVRNDGSSNFNAQFQRGKFVARAEGTFVSNVAPTSSNVLQSAAITQLVPTGAKAAWGNMGTTSTTVVQRLRVAANAAGLASFYKIFGTTPGSTVLNSFTEAVPFGPIPLDDSGNLYWSAQDNTNAVNRLTITAYSW